MTAPVHPPGLRPLWESPPSPRTEKAVTSGLVGEMPTVVLPLRASAGQDAQALMQARTQHVTKDTFSERLGSHGHVHPTALLPAV